MKQDRFTLKASEALQQTFQVASHRGNPEATPAHLLLADTHRAIGRCDVAGEHYDRYLVLEPDSPRRDRITRQRAECGQ